MIFLFCIGDPFQHDPFADQPPAPAGNSPFDDRTDVIQTICSQNKDFQGFPGFRFLVCMWERRNLTGCAFRINMLITCM